MQVVECEIPYKQEHRKIGLRINGRQINIYMLKDTMSADRAELVDLAELCRGVHQAIFMGTNTLRDYEWNIRNGYAECRATFSSSADLPAITGAHFSNTIVLYGRSYDCQDYNDDKFEEFTPVHELTIPPLEHPLSVTVQPYKSGHIYFQHKHNSSPDTSEIVLVDRLKFAALLREYSYYQIEHQPKKEHEWPLAKCDSNRALPLQKICCRKDPAGGLQFSISAGNRTLMAQMCADQNISSFPVAVNKEDAVLLSALCGVRNSGNSAPKFPRSF